MLCMVMPCVGADTVWVHCCYLAPCIVDLDVWPYSGTELLCFVCLAILLSGSVFLHFKDFLIFIYSGFIVFSYHNYGNTWLACNCLPPLRGTVFRYRSAVCLVCI